MAVEIMIATSASQLATVADGVFDRGIDAPLSDEFFSDPRHHLCIATESGIVVGFASALHYVHPDKPNQLWINEVGVSPSYRGRGVARALVRKMNEHGRLLGCCEAWVLTDVANMSARAAYEAAGGTAQSAGIMYVFDLRATRAEEFRCP